MTTPNDNDGLIDSLRKEEEAEAEKEREQSKKQLEEDRNKTLKVDFLEEEAPKYNLPFGYKMDKSTAHAFLPALIMYIVVVNYSNIIPDSDDCIFVKGFFYVSIILWLFLVHNRRTEKVIHISNEYTSLQRARESNIVILSVITLYSVFNCLCTRSLPDENSAKILVGYGIFSLLIGSIWYTCEDTPLNYRQIRNIHIAGTTSGLFCFILFILNKYFCN